MAIFEQALPHKVPQMMLAPGLLIEDTAIGSNPIRPKRDSLEKRLEPADRDEPPSH